ncbi:hypothetical protein [Rhodopseudomonas pseudopalustris]|uniref:Uncharacterized protein n=1 Tax=Rhodopseudomonas pseudopalustris TaxID=1513892 RepID=A0A1H8XCF1_9BRAD|nr:hypothetical protein [Rhodopseudomonas pseudopalustris]SEP36988.1 hypothetical protein SAMN05444123_11848 [Rhodopseudomonas pseudopalustris]
MGLRNWLFGGSKAQVPKAADTEAPNGKSDDSIFGDIIDIPSRNFIGLSAKSPNRRFSIAWCDGGPNQSRAGRYILLDRGKIVAEGKMARPNDGKVTDNGVFILNDWGDSESLSGVFAAFRPDGSTIVVRKFSANLYNNGLSADGTRAVCQTANAPGGDGNLLTAFDLIHGNELGAWRPESGWARSYEFSEDGNTIRLIYPERGGFLYSVDGKFIDRMKWLAAGLACGDLRTVETLLAETDNAPPYPLVQQLLEALKVALSAPVNNSPNARARILRFRGICFEAIAESRAALEAYDEALALDPKIGVKRKADRLRKVVL